MIYQVSNNLHFEQTHPSQEMLFQNCIDLQLSVPSFVCKSSLTFLISFIFLWTVFSGHLGFQIMQGEQMNYDVIFRAEK